MLDELFSLNGPYARAMNWLWNMLVISVLWAVCCIPVFTIGAASTAAYYAAAKCVRRHTGKVVSEFFSSFRLNFRQASVFTLLWGSVLFLLILECIYLYSNTAVPLAVLYLFYFLLAAAVSCTMYLWPCLSRFARSNLALIKTAVILTFRHLITTILLFLLLICSCLAVYLMPWGILVFPGCMFYLQTFLMEKILLQNSPRPSTPEEAEKWYYQ